jgi:hypothetical protein
LLNAMRSIDRCLMPEPFWYSIMREQRCGNDRSIRFAALKYFGAGG